MHENQFSKKLRKPGSTDSPPDRRIDRSLARAKDFSCTWQRAQAPASRKRDHTPNGPRRQLILENRARWLRNAPKLEPSTRWSSVHTEETTLAWRGLAAHRTTLGPQAETKTWRSCYNLCTPCCHGVVRLLCPRSEKRAGNASLSLVQVVQTCRYDKRKCSRVPRWRGTITLLLSCPPLSIFTRAFSAISRIQSAASRVESSFLDFPSLRRSHPRSLAGNVKNFRRLERCFQSSFTQWITVLLYFPALDLLRFSKRAFSCDARSSFAHAWTCWRNRGVRAMEDDLGSEQDSCWWAFEESTKVASESVNGILFFTLGRRRFLLVSVLGNIIENSSISDNENYLRNLSTSLLWLFLNSVNCYSISRKV